ncbi:hypothetical protein [Mesorhizobium sp. ORS 3428]|uniref:hypothetical protein n=1 Tax=Mesorhizobium sp. ORS 3428 TaxID=540997 RepID=UPI0008D9CF93|nr:hypothetical protein [Mesorhizobium sp. ORS 3428]OHV83849.1 hypothetical protein ORS3428_27280 [Mesorhizobium sp. ORS 3428]
MMKGFSSREVTPFYRMNMPCYESDKHSAPEGSLEEKCYTITALLITTPLVGLLFAFASQGTDLFDSTKPETVFLQSSSIPLPPR